MWKRTWSKGQLEAWVKRRVSVEFNRLPKRIDRVFAKATRLARRVDSLDSPAAIESCILGAITDSITYYYMFNMSPESLSELQEVVEDAKDLQTQSQG